MKKCIGIVAVILMAAGVANAATFSTNGVAPTVDGADMANLVVGNANEKWFSEDSGAGNPKGQTFTTTESVSLNALTYQLWTTSKTEPTKVYRIRLGVVDTSKNKFYEIYSEVATEFTTWPVNSYGTWTFDTPPVLHSNVVYGVDVGINSSTVSWQSGIPYLLHINANTFADGAKFSSLRVPGNPTGMGTDVMYMDSNRDRVFHLDMTSTTIVDTTSPTLTNFVDSVSGGPIFEDQVQVTYTLYFDESIDDTTIDIADFENLGTGVSLDSIVSINQTMPHPLPAVIEIVFGISGTGTLQLGLVSGSDITDMYTNTINSPASDGDTITVNSGSTPVAGMLYWDGPTTNGITDGVSQGGSGTWSQTVTSWDMGFGFADPFAWNNATAPTAILGGVPGTVTVDEAITLSNLTFTITGDNKNYTVEGETLNFTPGAVISVSDNRAWQTIKCAVTGSPDVTVKDWGAGNQYEGIRFAPSSGTQTLGDVLNPIHTAEHNTDKSGFAMGGSTAGNSVASINYGGNDRYGTVYVEGTADSEWTVGSIRTGTIRVSGGSIIITNNVESAYGGLQATGGKLGGAFDWVETDRRTSAYIYSGSTVAPGNSVGTITWYWAGTAGVNAGENDYSLWFKDGSTYEWEVGPAATDTIHLTNGRLYVDNMVLKIQDAGGTPSASDQLPVFTYDAGVAIDITGFLNTTASFDVTELGGSWDTSSLSLVDDAAGTVYLTGLSASGSGTLILLK